MLRVSEIFHSLQGEGTRQGRPSHFVRLTGCPLRCRWCDSAFAFHGGEDWSEEAILDRLRASRTRLVCVTGGEPLAQPQVHGLLRALCDAGFEVVLETSGALDASTVDPRVIRVMDLKVPGSGEVDRNLMSNFQSLRASDEIKFVLADRADYDWARDRIEELHLVDRVGAVLLSPVHGELDPAELAGWMLADDVDATLQLQQHKLLWPGVERGI